MTGTVLLAEHDPAVREMLRRYLVRDGFSVSVASTPEQTIAALETPPGRGEVAVLDLTMPGLDPRRLRRALGGRPAMPAVFLVASGPRPRGLTGPPAPRWLTRPFGPRLLTSAVRELLRTAATEPRGAQKRAVQVGGREVWLTATEHAFLIALLAAPGRPRSRAQLLASAGSHAAGRAVDVHIAQLRAKLGAPGLIRTVRGVGFVLEDTESVVIATGTQHAEPQGVTWPDANPWGQSQARPAGRATISGATLPT
jgi:DNA-binding response OmpR family regulator